MTINVFNEDDVTQLSDSQVVGRFLAEVASVPSTSVSEFFDRNADVDQKRHLVAIILADIDRQERLGHSVSPHGYFERFKQLASDSDSWRILEACESWLIANDGHDWVRKWTDVYPEVGKNLSNQSTARKVSTVGDDHVETLSLNDLQPGDRLLEFEILRFVGEGTFGRVYLVNDLTLNRKCALKITVDQGSEGQVLARLGHPGIVQVYRQQSLQGKRLLSMQYVDGSSLADWIEQNSESSSWGNRVVTGTRLVRDVATSLKHAHLRGVLHRDIKPANILIEKSGRPMLSDFNVATLVDAGDRFSVGGTVNYMSPEQLQAVCLNDVAAERKVDSRSDVYSLGVVLLEILTGQKVWSTSELVSENSAANQLLASRLRAGPPSVGNFPGVSASLAAIVDKALSPNADERYQSAAELETDLTNWLDGHNNTYAGNPSLTERVTRGLRRHRISSLVAASIVTLLLCAMVYGHVVADQHFTRCTRLLSATHTHVESRRLAKASESLGQAKSQLQQAGFARWVQPTRYVSLRNLLAKTSEEVSQMETQRFTSLYGEVSLREIHKERNSRLAGLIQDSLQAYNVLTAPRWQDQSPYIDLNTLQQEAVAEGVSELMLVSMCRSAKQNAPTSEEIQQVLDRLPRQHRDLTVFSHLKTHSEFSTPVYRKGLVDNPFDAYLHGVLATLTEDHESALNFYADALRDPRERFWCHYRYAFTCQKLNRSEEAFIHYGVCLGLQPDFAWPKFNMGLVCLERGKPQLAKGYISQALKADPKFTAAYVAMIALETQLENFEAAAEVFAEAQANGLHSAELSRNYNIAKFKLGQKRASE